MVKQESGGSLVAGGLVRINTNRDFSSTTVRNNIEIANPNVGKLLGMKDLIEYLEEEINLLMDEQSDKKSKMLRTLKLVCALSYVKAIKKYGGVLSIKNVDKEGGYKPDECKFNTLLKKAFNAFRVQSMVDIANNEGIPRPSEEDAQENGNGVYFEWWQQVVLAAKRGNGYLNWKERVLNGIYNEETHETVNGIVDDYLVAHLVIDGERGTEPDERPVTISRAELANYKQFKEAAEERRQEAIEAKKKKPKKGKKKQQKKQEESEEEEPEEEESETEEEESDEEPLVATKFKKIGKQLQRQASKITKSVPVLSEPRGRSRSTSRAPIKSNTSSRQSSRANTPVRKPSKIRSRSASRQSARSSSVVRTSKAKSSTAKKVKGGVPTTKKELKDFLNKKGFTGLSYLNKEQLEQEYEDYKKTKKVLHFHKEPDGEVVYD